MIYFYDGSKSGFLCALSAAYTDENAILTSSNAQLALGQEAVFIRPDEARAAQVEKRLLSFDRGCMRDLDALLRCGDHNRDAAALGYFKLLAAKKAPVRGMLAERYVSAAVECVRRVGLEVHRFHGFVRFLESESGALYAPISPDNDICDLLVPHFKARLPRYAFVIHDVKRKKAAVYDGEHTFLAPLERAEVALSANEEGWQALWRRYYESVNIPSRERLKQMRGYMPVRYWKFMPEKHPFPSDL